MMAAAAPTHKRKRASQDQDLVRSAPGFQSSSDMDSYTGVDTSAISQLLAHNANGQHPGSSQDHGLLSGSHGAGNAQSATEQAAAALQYDVGAPPSGEMPYPSHPPPGLADAYLAEQGFAMDPNQQPNNGGHSSGSKSPSQSAHKPQVGTEEWHKVRRDNHKEVERRRRETINEGITELSKIVPGCEKNKGSILQRAVQYIQQLKELEEQNLEKWTLDKMLSDQAISELSASVDRLDRNAKRAYAELDAWKTAAQRAGVNPDDVKVDVPDDAETQHMHVSVGVEQGDAVAGGEPLRDIEG